VAAAGAGAFSAVVAAGATGPSFVQQVSGHGLDRTSLAVTPSSAVTAGDRIIVEVGVWSSGAATAASVSDSAGNSYVEVTKVKASENTELSIWTAPVVAGGGTKPTITARPTATADVGVVALEYAGLSAANDASAVDVQRSASGTTGTSAANATSGPTTATTADGELALGFYNDSGFGDTLTGGGGYTVRANVSPASDMEMLAEDAVVTAGTTPGATAGTGARTTWEMATVVFAGANIVATAPSAPRNVIASAGNQQAGVSWSAPNSNGSAITSYTVTPHAGSTALTPVTVTGSPPATSTTVTGLVNGTSYTFDVLATNAVGSGPPATSNAVTPSAQPSGQWGAVQSWPIVAVHAVQLTDGRFLVWDGWRQPQPTYIWNPTTNSFSSVNAPDSIFCSGTAHLPDGRVLVIGGYGGLSTGQIGIVDTAIFNPSTGTWSRVANMHNPRWYPDLTELADGRYVAISGNSTDASHWADTPEVYDPSANTWTALTGISTAQVHEEEYPFSYLVPNGKVLTIGPSEDVTYQLDVTGNRWTPVGGTSGVTNGSSVMYRPGKILYSGGAPSVVTTTSAASATAVLDLSAPTPQWRQTTPMAYPRVYHTLTMLADGKVLAVGGEASSDQNNVATGVMPTEIWDPATETWTTAASIAAARNYHSTAVLMQDGRVLVAGGGHEEGSSDPGQFSAQIYSPSYLFAGPRPAIASAPSSADYGATIPISTPDAASIAAVNLVSLGADTHQSDMTQHFVPLSFSAGADGVAATAPATGAVAPPGNYMLFIVNSAGVPSVAAIVHIGGGGSQATAPAAPTNVVATAGNQSATVSWTAPSNGGAPISSYTVTPYVGSAAQTPVTVTGSPPATSTTVTGLASGTAYTFTVSAANSVGTGPESAPSNAVTPSSPTSPGAPTNVVATAGDRSAAVSWSAPPNGGAGITRYAVTPYIGTAAQTPTFVSGTPPGTTTTVTGLTNGTSYTFTVQATNSVGTGAESAPSNAVTPTNVVPPSFVQQAGGQARSVTSLTASPPSAVSTGDRMIVEVGSWSSGGATTSGVTDSAGNTYVKLTSFKASDGTELSLWTAPITAGGGARLTVTARATATTDLGLVASEYAGLSSVNDASAVDVLRNATGTTGASAAAVSSGATAPTTAANEIAIGFYADSGFGDALVGDPGYMPRANTSPNGDMELFVEDGPVAAGATPNASVTTGARTVWLMSTVVFRSGSSGSAPTAPGPPTGVTAAAGDTTAAVSWVAPSNGGSPITAYTVTPYVGAAAQTPVTVTGNPPATGTTVTGLTDGTTYTFQVTASNAVGTGPPSAPSNAVTPSAPTSGITVDKSLFRDGKGALTTPSFSTSSGAEILVAYVGYDGPSGGGKQTATVSGAGLTWTLAKRVNTQSGDAEIWWAKAAAALSGATVTATPKAGGYYGSLSLLTYQKATGIGSVAGAGAPSGAPGVTVTGVPAGGWVFAVGNDWDGATARGLPSGQSLVHQYLAPAGDTIWVQSTSTSSPGGGTVDIDDTSPTSDQWNLAAVTVVP